MVYRITKVNPVAKAMVQQRRRQQYVPDKTKYNRKKDNVNESKYQENADQKGEQEST